MSQISAYGIQFQIPASWSSRVIAPISDGDEGSGVTIHAASYAMPLDDASYASTIMAQLGPLDLAFALLEMLPDGDLQPGQGLFASPPPIVAALVFDPQSLQVTLPGQLGVQSFFTVSQRAFSLYAVMGSAGAVPNLVGLGQMLLSLQVSPPG